MKNYSYIIVLLLFTVTSYAQVCPGTPGQITWECWKGIYDDQFGELTALPAYPQAPSVTKVAYKIQSPINYDNYIGGRLRGYIYVPATTTATFNVTGDDKVRFYLSTDSSPENKQLQAISYSATSVAEHDNEPSQTSNPITLVSGTDYYFEVEYVEQGGGDHATLYWKTDLVSPTDWNIVTAGFLKNVDCVDLCPLPGTACDDGNSATINDMEDGNCNCIGEVSSSVSCVGDRGMLEHFEYWDIPGGDLNDLYNNAAFPAMPHYSSYRDLFAKPRIYPDSTNNGDLVQAFLRVPISGNYKFNVTGDDHTVLFLSSNEDPANKQAHQAVVSGNTGMTQHDKWIWQSTGNIYLDANQFYFIELNHKQGSGAEHFSIFWQTPFTQDGQWKRIPSLYFYDYDCDIACIAEGTLCDDGNPFTNDDAYDANCDCVGIPCVGEDCDSPLASYVPFDKCGLTGQLGTSEANQWVSCETTQNPNTARGTGHWIQYDLGVKHEIHESHIWNYNVPSRLHQGMENVAIDYSVDGSTWTTLGTYNWSLATGQQTYAGFAGPNFMGAEAKYILISSLDSNEPCRGLGKVAFQAVVCPDIGTPCDDGNPDTYDDQYDENCECKGIDFLQNDCEEDFVILGDSVLTVPQYSAIDYVQSISEIDAALKTSLVAGNSVQLNPGFETQADAVFIAAIDTCDTNAGRFATASRKSIIYEQIAEQEQAKIDVLKVTENKEQGTVTVHYYVEQAGKILLQIESKEQSRPFILASHEVMSPGVYQKTFKTKKFGAGVHMVTFKTNQNSLVGRFTVQ